MGGCGIWSILLCVVSKNYLEGITAMTTNEAAQVLFVQLHARQANTTDMDRYQVETIAIALRDAEARTWEEAAKDLAHGLPAIWKDALRKRCAFQATARRTGKEAE
jgi:hypothetical protein